MKTLSKPVSKPVLPLYAITLIADIISGLSKDKDYNKKEITEIRNNLYRNDPLLRGTCNKRLFRKKLQSFMNELK